MSHWQTAPDKELIRNALDLWANYVETGSPTLSANDLRAQGKPAKTLHSDSLLLVRRLRQLARKHV